MIQLGIIDANDMLVEAELDDSVYNIGLSWNQEGQLWTISVRDLNFSLLVSGIAAVPGFPLLYQVRRTELPPGQLWIYSVNNNKLNRKSFVNGEAGLFYFTAEESVVK
jgi:hypothetical protein